MSELNRIRSGRYEVVRDDGDDGIGLGYSYRYYECVEGVWSSVNQEFTRCYERITPESNKYYLYDIAAIIGVGGSGKALMWVKHLPDPEPGFIPDNGFRVFTRGYDGFMHEDKRLYPKKPRPMLY